MEYLTVGNKKGKNAFKNRMDTYPKLVERFYEYDERGYHYQTFPIHQIIDRVNYKGT